ncbi:hypothetical protein SELMODRAFT_425052 [Selaginella moellendorffii]|uniref:Uncharacterized protein n=1 Tax=Selaginella moellendorffii TaxID=88036 RepID=D8SRV8_SELML|nr:hypothetical protein SELMODRAFT_425052 [Selaginella moellendorffii]
MWRLLGLGAALFLLGNPWMWLPFSSRAPGSPPPPSDVDVFSHGAYLHKRIVESPLYWLGFASSLVSLFAAAAFLRFCIVDLGDGSGTATVKGFSPVLVLIFMWMVSTASLVEKWILDDNARGRLAAYTCAFSGIFLLASAMLVVPYLQERDRRVWTAIYSVTTVMAWPSFALLRKSPEFYRVTATAVTYGMAQVAPLAVRGYYKLPFPWKTSFAYYSLLSLVSSILWAIYSGVVERYMVHMVGAALSIAVNVLYLAFYVEKMYSAIRYWHLACFTDTLYVLLALGSLTGVVIGVLAYFHHKWCMLISFIVGAISATLIPLAPHSSLFVVLQVLSAMAHFCAGMTSICRLVEETPAPGFIYLKSQYVPGYKPNENFDLDGDEACTIMSVLDWKWGNRVVALVDVVLILVLVAEMIALAIVDKYIIRRVNHS